MSLDLERSAPSARSGRCSQCHRSRRCTQYYGPRRLPVCDACAVPLRLLAKFTLGEHAPEAARRPGTRRVRC